MEKAIAKIRENAASWYAVCTAPRAEERAKKQLEQSGFECYSPLQFVVRAWANQKKKVLIPVMSGVLFVHLSEADVLKVAALKIVSFLQKKEGGYVSVSGEQLEQIHIDGLETLLLQK